jgi:hypothetical protein
MHSFIKFVLTIAQSCLCCEFLIFSINCAILRLHIDCKRNTLNRNKILRTKTHAEYVLEAPFCKELFTAVSIISMPIGVTTCA